LPATTTPSTYSHRARRRLYLIWDRLSGQDLPHAVDARPIPGMSDEPLLDRMGQEIAKAADLAASFADQDGPVAASYGFAPRAELL
jgi:hypothetical protein